MSLSFLSLHFWKLRCDPAPPALLTYKHRPWFWGAELNHFKLSKCILFAQKQVELAWTAAPRVSSCGALGGPVMCSHIHSLPIVCCEWWLDSRTCPRGCWARCCWQLVPWISEMSAAVMKGKQKVTHCSCMWWACDFWATMLSWLQTTLSVI